MISIGLVDLVLILLVLLTLYAASRTHARALYAVLLLIFIIITVERLIPGTLLSIGNAIRSIDRINDAGPHLTIAPVISFK